jgi:hypothetical protein
MYEGNFRFAHVSCHNPNFANITDIIKGEGQAIAKGGQRPWKPKKR